MFILAVFKPYYFNLSFSDFEHFQDTIKQWDLDFRKISKGSFQASTQMLDFGTVQLSKTKFSGTLLQRGVAPIGYRTFVVFAHNSQKLLWLNNNTAPKDLIIYREDNFWESVSYDNFDMFVISIQQNHLNSIIDESGFTNSNKNLRSDEMIVSMDKKTLYSIRNFLIQLFYKLDQNSIAIHSPNLQNKVLYKLPKLLLQILDGGYEETKSKNNRKRDKAIKKAISFIEENPLEAISIPKICDYAQVSPRTLEYGFQEQFLVGPKQYAKATKLNAVRQELLTAHNKPLITEIANKHGFNHMGQFSADYKSLFGEVPSQSLLKKF